jgi:zinc/manganese transport system substrate-binding protein
VTRRHASPLARAIALIVIGSAALSACGPDASDSGAGTTLRVVATTTQIGDMARNVAGGEAAVTTILAPNADAHDFEPTPKDAEAVAAATIVLANGRDLDPWIDGVVAGSGTSAKPVIVTEGVPMVPGGEKSPDGDPHVWFDPRNAEAMVNRIAAAMSDSRPAKASAFRANADAYITEIRSLDAQLATRIAAIPRARRVIVTDHDAFGYLARRYDIRVLGAAIPSQATTAEPSAREISELIALIRREGVRVVFPEASVNAGLARRIAGESGARLGGALYSDSLGPAGSGADTYLSMMRTNIESMAAGMSGT